MVEYLLKESFKKNLCPICHTIETQMNEFLFWFEREGYHEYSSVKALFERSCICSRHRGELIKLKDKLNNTFELLIEMEEKELKELMKTRNPKRKAKEIKKNCRFCIEEKRIEEHAIETFVKSKELVEDYLNSRSLLCKKHTLLIIENLDKKELAQKILKKALHSLDIMHERIESYFKKIDYRSKEKPEEEELNAFLEALKFFSNL